MKKTEKVYCFDFDGTIANTLPLIVKTVNDILKKQKEEEVSDEMLRKIRREGIEEVLKEDVGIPFYKLVFLYLTIRRDMNKEMSSFTITGEMKDTLKKLHREGHTLGIITSNSKKNVNSFLENNDIDIFKFINASGLFGKKRVIKKLKKKGGIFIYVGDEPRDIIAGRRAGVKTVAVLWGLSSRRALVKARPDIIIEKPYDLLNLSF